MATSHDTVSNEAEAIEKIAELAVAGSAPSVTHLDVRELGGGLPGQIPLLITPGPNGGKATSLRSLIEEYRTGPERRKGTATVTTLAAFVDIVNRHKDDGSVIFAKTDWPNPALTAVIDYHGLDHAPRHGEHRIRYTFPVTPEFQAWIDGNGKKMEQGDFALFLEDHAAELSSPYDAEKIEFERLFKAVFANPNELIDLSRSLEVHVGQSVKNSVKLQSGEGEIQFVEEHTNKAGEKITVPGVFMISLRAFRDGGLVRIPARLRYRVAGGAIVWMFHLYRWEDELQNRVAEDLAYAGTKTGLPTFEGALKAVADATSSRELPPAGHFGGAAPSAPRRLSSLRTAHDADHGGTLRVGAGADRHGPRGRAAQHHSDPVEPAARDGRQAPDRARH